MPGGGKVSTGDDESDSGNGVQDEEAKIAREFASGGPKIDLWESVSMVTCLKLWTVLEGSLDAVGAVIPISTNVMPWHVCIFWMSL
jgi:hypothetical protein